MNLSIHRSPVGPGKLCEWRGGRTVRLILEKEVNYERCVHGGDKHQNYVHFFEQPTGHAPFLLSILK
jgi:hypothetical protein